MTKTRLLTNGRKRFWAMLLAILLICSAAPGATAIGNVENVINSVVKDGIESIYNSAQQLFITAYVCTDPPYYTTEDLLNESTLIATGKITGRSESYVIETVDGGCRQPFRNYSFAITNTLKGEPYADTVSIRVDGGEMDGLEYNYDSAPKFNQEDEYLLFLYRSDCGGGFETQDDYYNLTGLIQGAYVLGSDGVYRNVQDDEVLPSEVFISPHMDEELDENYYRNKALKAFKGNYETGFITKEEYDKYVAGLDKYARIVK